MPETKFKTECAQIPIGSKLYLFSDGAFELARANGGTHELKDLIAEMEKAPADSRLDAALAWARSVHAQPVFDDDLTLMEISL